MFSIDRSFLYGAFDVFFKSSIFYIGCTFFIASFIFLTCSSTTFFFFRWHGFLKIFLVCGVYLQNQLWLCVYLGNRVRDLNHGRRLSLVICVAKGNQLSSDHYEIKNPVTYLILDSFWSATFKGRQFWFFYQIVNSSKIHGSITKKKKKKKKKNNIDRIRLCLEVSKLFPEQMAPAWPHVVPILLRRSESKSQFAYSLSMSYYDDIMMMPNTSNWMQN